MRRVAITGMGAVSPLGNDAEATWEGLLAGRSGIDFIRSFDASQFPVRIAGEVKDFEPNGLLTTKSGRNADKSILFAIAAGKEALAEAGVNGYEPERVGAVIGCCVGGVNQMVEQWETLKERGWNRMSPYFIPNFLVDAPGGQLAIELGFKGPNFAVVSACATGSSSIGEGAELIRDDEADMVLAGGTEGAITPLILGGFCAMRGLAMDDENPPLAARPFDANRQGFVMAEGAAVLVLEELERAKARGATIYAEVLGHGTSNDAYHMAQPDPSAQGVVAMMQAALENAEIEPDQVDYVNAHGTGTPLGDAAETKALKEVFGDHAYDLAVSSTKSMTGHMFGAAGAVEAMACARAIHEGVIPPTINYEQPDPDCDLDYVPNEPRKAEVRVALSNAMGLGGHNACVLLGRVD